MFDFIEDVSGRKTFKDIFTFIYEYGCFLSSCYIWVPHVKEPEECLRSSGTGVRMTVI